MTPGYEAREAILQALGTGQAEAAGALVLIYCPENDTALGAVRYCLRLERLYRCRQKWGRNRPADRQVAASDFGLREAIRVTEIAAEDSRHKLADLWPLPTGDDRPLF